MRLLAPVLALALTVAAVPHASAPAPFEVTINGPAYALAGATVTFSGAYGVRAVLLAPFVGYEVRLWVDGVPRGIDTIVPGTWAVAHTFPARGPSQVHAVAEEGRPGEATSPVKAVQVAVPPTPAQGVAATVLGGSLSAQVTWAPPLDDGGAPISSYRVLRQDGAGAFVQKANVSAGTLQFTDTNLAVGPAYTYRVIAHNLVAAGPAADAPLTGTPPPAPVVAATPVHLSPQVQVAVTQGGEVTQQLQLERSLNGGASWAVLKVQNGTALAHTDTIPLPSAPLYRALARNLAGASPYAQVSPSGPLPGVPANLSMSVGASVTLSWSHPPSGGPVQGYRVLDNGAVVADLHYTSLSHAFTVAPGTHALTVAATSVAGVGAPADPIPLTLAKASAPQGLAALAIEELHWGRVNLSWAAPLDDGGAPIQGYKVYRTNLSTGARVGLPALNASTFALSDGNLKDNATYRYEVMALTAAGEGHAAIVQASISDFQWVLQHAILHFTMCETIGGSQTCTQVAPGGMYDRQGTGQVKYNATYEGLITRKGVGVEGRNAWGLIWESWDEDGENADSFLSTTNSTGRYRASWTETTSLTPQPGCSQVSFDSHASYWTMFVITADDAALICP